MHNHILNFNFNNSDKIRQLAVEFALLFRDSFSLDKQTAESLYNEITPL